MRLSRWRRAVLRRSGQGILIEPRACWPLIQQALTRVYLLGVSNREGKPFGYPQEFFRLRDRHPRCLTTGAGMEPIVAQILQERGYTVMRTGRRPQPLPEPDLAAIEVGPPTDHAVLDFVGRHERGLIRYRDGLVHPAWLIAQLARAFPRATFSVLGYSETRLRELVDRLAGFGVEAHWAAPWNNLPIPARVVLGTPWGICLPQYDLRARHVVIALDALHALHARSMEALKYAYRARMYGLLESGRRYGAEERDQLVHLFGPETATLEQHGLRDRSVVVETSRIDGGAKFEATDGLDLNRRGVWRHPVRNRHVARLASQLCAGDSTGTGPVVVLVESLEHAAALAKLLDDWPVVAASDCILDGLHASERQRLESALWRFPGLPARFIATWAGLTEMPAVRIDAMIRADGLQELPTFLARGPLTREASAPPLRLFDFRDHHRPELRRRSQQRLASYHQRGWRVDGTPAPDAIARVLKDWREHRYEL